MERVAMLLFFCGFLVVVFLVVVGGESSHVNVGRGSGRSKNCILKIFQFLTFL